MDTLFLPGCFVGFIFATFVGYVFGQIQRARNLVNAPDRFQAAQVQTNRTPRQVMQAAFSASMQIIGWVIILVMASGLLLVLLRSSI